MLHAGWRGVVGGVIERGLEMIGTPLAAWIGPSIHSCCYQVGPEVIAAFENRGTPCCRRLPRRSSTSRGAHPDHRWGPGGGRYRMHVPRSRLFPTRATGSPAAKVRSCGWSEREARLGDRTHRGACARSHRDPSDVRLVAVSKTFPVADVLAAIDAGATDLGENRAQELRDKAVTITERGVRWHFIGHLQSNKARLVVGVATLIHSVIGSPSPKRSPAGRPKPASPKRSSSRSTSGVSPPSTGRSRTASPHSRRRSASSTASR